MTARQVWRLSGTIEWKDDCGFLHTDITADTMQQAIDAYNRIALERYKNFAVTDVIVTKAERTGMVWV